ncbi:MAG: DUF2817 domain-containing protein, partial [Planctomycetota bacterium]
LERRLAEEPALTHGRRVVVVPVLNPDGYARSSRHNANGVDLNRNFPASNFQASRRTGAEPLSEPEARALHDLIHEYMPDRVIVMHQPLSCIDYDGPAHELARALADDCTLPVRKLGARPGSLGSYAGETLRIATITVELPGGATRLDSETLWSAYGRMLVTAITWDGEETVTAP